MDEGESGPAAPPERAFLTADVPGVRAEFRTSPEDFEVDEVPRGPPPPGDSHVWVRIEKRGISTDEACRRIARRLAQDEHAIGYAGRKDAHGVTRQWISIERAAIPSAAALEGEDEIRVVDALPAGRKITLGELRGNRFAVRLRGVSEVDEQRAREVAQRLKLFGAPNYFGVQRFGIRGNSHAIGRAILLARWREALDLLLGAPHAAEGPRLQEARAAYGRGDLAGALAAFPRSFGPELRAIEALRRGANSERALEALPFRTRELYLAAYQAALFNRLLADRVRAGALAGLEPGDLAWVHATGEVLPIEDPWPLGARVQRLEVSATLPLFGHAAPRPAGEPGARELRLLAAEGIGYDTWARPKGLALRGARRPVRFAIEDLSIAREGEDLLLRFFLGPGSYATALVDEILKTS